MATWSATSTDPEMDDPIRLRALRPNGRLTRVRTVSPPAPGGSQPSVDVTGRGRGVVAWSSATAVNGLAVYGRTFTRTGKLGTVHRLSGPEPDSSVSDWTPEVTVAPTGRILVTWDHELTGSPATVMGRFVSRRGHLGPLLTFHQSLGWNPEPVAACPDGSVVVATAIHRRDLVLQRITRSGKITHRNVTADLVGLPVQAAIECDSSAAVHVLVNLRHGGTAFRMTARLRTWQRSGRLSSASRVTPRGEQPVSIGLATDGHGDSVVAWYEHLAAAYTYRLRVRAVSATGHAGTVRDLGRVRTGPISGFDLPPGVVVSVDRTGRGAIAWCRMMKDTSDFATYGRAIRPGGALAPLTRLGRSAAWPRVDSPSHGRAAVLYVQGDGTYHMRLRLAP